ncbi:MAG: archease [Solirubrobacterales bacterium]|nr:archease [Solirubrobacterales bacterium]
MFYWAPHTSELELHIEAAGEHEVFIDALLGVAELLGVDVRREPDVCRRLRAQAGDRPALLAAWLEELIFVVETEGFEPVGVRELRLEDESAEALVVGSLGEPPPLIKAVTYHGLTFAAVEGGYRASVVLDV